MYCSKCGTQNKLENNFCEACGSPLDKTSLSNNNYSYPISVNQDKNDGLGVGSVCLGVFTIMFFWLIPLAIPTGITGLVLGNKSKVKKGTSTAGIILNTIGLAFTFIIVAIIIALIMFGIDIIESLAEASWV